MNVGQWRAVLFDLDDTLVDYSSAASIEQRCIDRVVRSFLPADAMAEFHTRYQDHLDRRHEEVDTGRISVSEYRRQRLEYAMAVRGTPTEALYDAVAACADGTAVRADLMDGAIELLQSLRAAGIRVGIVTNGPTPMQLYKCRRLGLTKVVDTVVTSEDVRRTKPDAVVFHEALRRLDVPASRAVVIGDSWENDVLAGLHAGCAAAVHICRLSAQTDTAAGLLARLPRVGRELLDTLEVTVVES